MIFADEQFSQYQLIFLPVQRSLDIERLRKRLYHLLHFVIRLNLLHHLYDQFQQLQDVDLLHMFQVLLLILDELL